MEVEETNTEKKVLGEISSDQLEALKTQYGKIVSAKFMHDESEEEAIVYLKKIDRKGFVIANDFYKTDEVKAAEYILKNYAVAGFDTKIIIADFDWLRNCTPTILPMLFVVRGELKKN